MSDPVQTSSVESNHKDSQNDVTKSEMMTDPPATSSFASNNDTANNNFLNSTGIPKHSKLPQSPETYTLRQKLWVHGLAERPTIFLCTALTLSLVLSAVGLVFGNFEVAADNAGWQTRGTLIADRHSQFLVAYLNRKELFLDTNGDVWNDLVQTVQPGWETEDDDIFDETADDDDAFWEAQRSRVLQLDSGTFQHQRATLADLWSGTRRLRFQHAMERPAYTRDLPFLLSPTMQRRLQESNTTTNNVLEGCDVTWYTEELLEDSRLWPMWRPRTDTTDNVSIMLSGDVLRDLCLSEEVTQRELEQSHLCVPCNDDDKCLPPYSLVLFARLTVANGLSLTCEGLAEAWTTYHDVNPDFYDNLVQCASFMATLSLSDLTGEDAVPLSELDESCPLYFSPTMMDELFPTSGTVAYTSSIFATLANQTVIEDMYDIVDSFSRGTSSIEGVYDTQNEDFVELTVDEALVRDMALALGSAVITLMAILIHTRSPFLSVMGLVQIILSFPLSFTFYTFVGRLEFFPFLNFIGVFVVFALGADDIFVAVDKWKNARIELVPSATVSDVAAIALPDAAGAMLLTTLTTAVAFFGTAICPVAPIRMFAIFCGLLIVFDYIMCILLMFPALCIYDKWITNRPGCCCCHCQACRQCGEEDSDDEDEAGDNEPQEDDYAKKAKPGEHSHHSSLIHRLLSSMYEAIHQTRYFLCLVCLVALILSVIFAAKMTLPTSSDVRLLDSDSNQYEKNYEWRQKLLYEVISRKGGSAAFVLWGATPADTGDHGNPETFTQMVLDDSFVPSDTEAQVYLRNFCDRFFANEWASPLPGDETTEEACALNKFDAWLHEQSASPEPEPIYQAYCQNATGLPMVETAFDSCIYNWGQHTREDSVLAWDGKVRLLFFGFNSRVRYDSPYDDLDRDWNAMEDWMKNERHTGTAPPSASNAFFTSDDFWWYDTNGNMLRTAYAASAIAIATSAVVILVSSRSVILTFFSTFTIGYVLASVTACLVAIGWTLGFLESVCFAILIGISCDFVIHLTHAYSSVHVIGSTHSSDSISCHDRTKFALLRMGPSILAAAFTTVAAAVIMLFTVVSFFVKFAVILLFTVLQATVGSLIVFLVLADTFGPSEPTKTYDWVVSKLCGGTTEEFLAEREVSEVPARNDDFGQEVPVNYSDISC